MSRAKTGTTTPKPARAPAPTLASSGLISVLVHRVFAWLTSLLIFIVSLGPIPNHVAFVMDGNRRYARGKGQQVRDGHTEGFESLKRTLEICLKLKIRAVTVYAFSIDNFKRTQEEVDALMGLAKTKLSELAQHGDLLEEYGVRIRFVGRRSMLPPDVIQAVDEMEAMTAGNKNGVLNVCSPYTSRDEITTALRDTVQEVYDGSLALRHLEQERIYRNLETCKNVAGVTLSAHHSPERDIEAECGKVDIFVRTSDVRRLSDFQMWQAARDTQLHFVKTYWPEFGLTDMLPILLGWQHKVWLRSLGL